MSDTLTPVLADAPEQVDAVTDGPQDQLEDQFEDRLEDQLVEEISIDGMCGVY